MNNKRIPPAVGEFAVGERGKLLARIAELEGALADLLDCPASVAQATVPRAALKAQPSGVVLPERIAKPATRTEESFGYRNGWNACLDEVARLNQPASSGDQCMCGGNPHTTQCLYEHFLSYSGLSDQPILRYAYFHGADDHCEKPATAGDERAAFDKWFRYEQMIADHIDTTFISSAFLPYRAWQARAALSANHSEQVRHMVMEGVTVERDVFGTIHIKSGDFDFIQIRYQYPYTDNSGTWKLAGRIVALLAAAPSAGSQKEQE